MQRVFRYVETIEEINHVDRLRERFADVKMLALRRSAVDAARAAWLTLPEEWRAKLEPPPDDLV